MKEKEQTCPTCHSLDVVKNGKTHHGAQNYKCMVCGRQFSGKSCEPEVIPVQTEAELFPKLMQERLSMRAIARILSRSLGYVYDHILEILDPLGDIFALVDGTKYKYYTHLNVEIDELWSFLGSKKEKIWIWVARCRETKEIIGFAVGDRSAETGKILWESIPKQVREIAHFYTDFWEAYNTFIPEKQHTTGKEHTSFIEGTNNALRQRIGRLVRKTCSFFSLLGQFRKTK